MIRDKVLKWLKKIDYMPKMMEYIAIPSVSNRKLDVKMAGDEAITILKDLGFDIQSYPNSGNDIILGTSFADERAPSILIYGHYDVQSEGNLDEWISPPYEPEIRGDKLFGRGSADNKGQHYAQFLALRYLKENNPEIFDKLNIKFILDGNEEEGSYSLPEVIERYQKEFSADFVYVSDGPSLSFDTPSIVGSVRGVLAFQITIKYNNSDLHSGNFGGIARSATRDLISLISAMVDENGKSKIPGFYDDLIPATEKEVFSLKKLETLYDTIIEKNGITTAHTIDDLSIYDQNQFYSTFNVNGIKAGAVGDSARTIIPQQATVSVDCRIIPDQDASKIEGLIEQFCRNWVLSNNIDEKQFEIKFEAAMWPIKSSMNSPYFDKVVEAARVGFGKEPMVTPRLGGSLPLYLFDKYLKIPVILVPYALPDERNHAPNENLDIPFFESGVATTVTLLLDMVNIK